MNLRKSPSEINQNDFFTSYIKILWVQTSTNNPSTTKALLLREKDMDETDYCNWKEAWHYKRNAKAFTENKIQGKAKVWLSI